MKVGKQTNVFPPLFYDDGSIIRWNADLIKLDNYMTKITTITFYRKTSFRPEPFVSQRRQEGSLFNFKKTHFKTFVFAIRNG